ncbi:tripartite motif-containing protein 16-like isoform X2 [Triplophysa dalaica]|uniref:tripartite motif-containing protein 16-like isoform X2 n=1 Tax=Triplophysa dalaica TaxID=1582913 RepID=UPI0024DF9A50|nr:tripartite motif-containing protein 16-like isoform X2 [Triplophysa dalaica]
MAVCGGDQNQNYLNCSVCLELLIDPVTIPCGHSYCMSCIQKYWDQENAQKKPCSCPQCREVFSLRPALKKCTALADAVSNRNTLSPPVHYFRGVADEYCDFCTSVKRKAVRSCLTCLASYCETHVRGHYEFRALQRHELVPSSCLQDKICKSHNKLLEVFCVDDKCCICILCMIDRHCGHKTTSAAEAWKKQKTLLSVMQLKSKQQIKVHELELLTLSKAVTHFSNSAQAVLNLSDKFRNTIVEACEKMFSKINELVRRRESIELMRATALQNHTGNKLAALKIRDAELCELGQTEDYIYFLQKFQALTTSGPDILGFVKEQPSFDLLSIESTLSEQKKSLEELFQKNIEMFSETDVSKLKFHIDSAHYDLKISHDGQKVEGYDCYVPFRSGNPEQFTYWKQVLCVEEVKSRSYWEALWSGTGVHFAVSYNSIVRKDGGNNSRFGYNKLSWSLACFNHECYFIHNGVKTDILSPKCSRIGVYVDVKAGSLSFYCISDSEAMKLLHKECTVFSEPLYAGFTLVSRSSVTLCS